MTKHIEEIDDIFLDCCSKECVATHTEQEHQVLKEVMKDRVIDLIIKIHTDAIKELEEEIIYQEIHKEEWTNGEYDKMANYYMNIGYNNATKEAITYHEKEISKLKK